MATDPRLDPDATSERSTLPVIRRSSGSLPGWVIAIAVAMIALLLFGLLDARRRSLQAPTAQVRPVDDVRLPPALPPLVIPPEPVVIVPPPAEIPPLPVSRPNPMPTPATMLPVQRSLPILPVQPAPVSPTAAPRPAGAGGSAVVVDTSIPRATPSSSPVGGGVPIAGGVGNTDRVRASMFADRSTTVPQGTLIPAVLETAFNSTRAGFARALVSRDVMGFDGTRVLIPRGSRLIGEYQSDAQPGQKRALVVWTRLIRPDGATIAIASPAADPLGRGGVKADVNTHFLERFSGAILQSALDVGVNLASRSANGAVIVALPNTMQTGAAQLVRPNAIPPTLSVKPGVSIGVFVARDLDFTDVEVER